MLQEVALGQKSLTDYTHIVGKDLTARIREQAIGAKLSQALDPGQQVVKIDNNELTAMLTAGMKKLHPAAVVMLLALCAMLFPFSSL